MNEFLSTDRLNDVANWILLGSAPAIVLFVAYFSRSDWRSTRVGRALMYQALGMTLIVLVVLASLFFGDYPGREYVRLVGYTVLTTVLWRMFFVLRSYQREGDVAVSPFRRRGRARHAAPGDGR